MKKIIFVLLLIFFPLSAQAASDEGQQDIINQQQNQVIQNQKQIDREKELEAEMKRVKKEQAQQPEIDQWEIDNLSQNDGKVIQDFRAIQCFRIHNITFSANRLLSKSEEKALTEKYLGKCMTMDWITKFSKEVTNHLVEKGYATSRAEVPPQNLLDGNLRVNIIESHLENIIINDGKFLDKMQKITAFGFPEGDEKVLNLYEIERGIDQMNRLSSNNAVIKILPGTADNQSIVAVENHPKNTTRINASYDNIGSATTGEKRDTISLAQDNLLHLNDSFSISRTSNDFDPEYYKKRSGSTSGNFSVPLGRHTFSLSISRSSYLFLTGPSKTTRAHGKTLTKTAGFDSILIKNKKFKITSNFNISSRNNQNFTGDVKTEVSSRKASIATASLSNTFFFDDGSLFLKPSYSKSLNILDAQKNSANLPSNAAHAQFDIFKFYGNYGKKFTIPYFKTPTSYSFTLDSQIAKQKLYGVDQFSSGGFYSVRGFRSSSISADSGYNLRNEFSANLGQLILPQFNSEKISKNLAYLNYLSLTPFYDYGHVRMRGGVQSGRLSGTGFKLSFAKNHLNASLTFARATAKSQMILQNRNEGSLVYFDLGAELDFF